MIQRSKEQAIHARDYRQTYVERVSISSRCKGSNGMPVGYPSPTCYHQEVCCTKTKVDWWGRQAMLLSSQDVGHHQVYEGMYWDWELAPTWEVWEDNQVFLLLRTSTWCVQVYLQSMMFRIVMWIRYSWWNSCRSKTNSHMMRGWGRDEVSVPLETGSVKEI